MRNVLANRFESQLNLDDLANQQKQARIFFMVMLFLLFGVLIPIRLSQFDYFKETVHMDFLMSGVIEFLLHIVLFFCYLNFGFSVHFILQLKNKKIKNRRFNRFICILFVGYMMVNELWGFFITTYSRIQYADADFDCESFFHPL